MKKTKTISLKTLFNRAYRAAMEEATRNDRYFSKVHDLKKASKPTQEGFKAAVKYVLQMVKEGKFKP